MKKALLSFSLLLILCSCLNTSIAQIHISINILPAEPFVERPPQPTANHVWIEGEWVMSAQSRRVRRYKLTLAGRRQLERETTQFDRMFAGIRKVMRAT